MSDKMSNKINNHAIIEIHQQDWKNVDNRSFYNDGIESTPPPPPTSTNIYIPLIGDLDGTICNTSDTLSNDKSKLCSDSNSIYSTKARPNTITTTTTTTRVPTRNLKQTSVLNHHNEWQGSSAFSYMLLFRRLLQNYSYPTKFQSWTEFLDTSRMRTPISPNQIRRRLTNNLEYFQGNYLCLFIILFIYCVLTSPLLLLAIAIICGALYFVTVISHQSLSQRDARPLNILGIEPTLQQQYTVITVFSLPLLWVSGAPTALFWVLGASFFVIGLHSAIYAIEVDKNKSELDDRNRRNLTTTIHQRQQSDNDAVILGQILDI